MRGLEFSTQLWGDLLSKMTSPTEQRRSVAKTCEQVDLHRRRTKQLYPVLVVLISATDRDLFQDKTRQDKTISLSGGSNGLPWWLRNSIKLLDCLVKPIGIARSIGCGNGRKI